MIAHAPSRQPEVSIAITRYAEPDAVLLDALEGLAAQRAVRAEVLLLDQAPSTRITEACRALSNTCIRFRSEAIEVKGLSFARNEAIRRATTERLLYLDADAAPDRDWAQRLARALSGDSVGVVGARILPRWQARPLLLANAPLVRDQYSVFDLGTGVREVSRVVGAGFGIHLGRLGRDAYFDERLGRRPGTLISGEEAELCHRARARGLRVVYDGSALVHHQILPERIRYRWLLRRFFYTGLNRAWLGGTPNPSEPLCGWDYVALAVVLPSYLAGFLVGRLRRQ